MEATASSSSSAAPSASSGSKRKSPDHHTDSDSRRDEEDDQRNDDQEASDSPTDDKEEDEPSSNRDNDDPDKTSPDPDGPYVVVTTTYPTEYGCNRGRHWDRADLIWRSDVTSSKPYRSYTSAVKEARRLRNNNEVFDAMCDDDSMDEYWGRDPPWDSAKAENYDNDEEILIDVMTKKKFDEIEADDKAYLEMARCKKMFEVKLRRGLDARRVKAAGRVHYSQPPQPYDIPAEVEIDLEEVAEEKEKSAKEKKEDTDDTSDKSAAKAAEAVNIPNNAASVKTLMFRCGKTWVESYRRRQSHSAKPSADAGDPLLHTLSHFTSLQELHLQLESGNVELTDDYVEAMLDAAPDLARTLRVLSLGVFFQLEPSAVAALGAFKGLERLDIADTFSSEHYNFDQCGGLGGFGDSDEEEEEYPYDVPLLECVEALENLKRLDIGYGDPEMTRYLYDYMLSRGCLYSIQGEMAERGGVITMDDRRTPDEFANSDAATRAAREVLEELAKNEDEVEGIRALAREELMGM